MIEKIGRLVGGGGRHLQSLLLLKKTEHTGAFCERFYLRILVTSCRHHRSGGATQMVAALRHWYLFHHEYHVWCSQVNCLSITESTQRRGDYVSPLLLDFLEDLWLLKLHRSGV